MSYDLFMKPRNKIVSKEDFQSYFLGRENYSLQGDEVHYLNEKTGVYFYWDYRDKEHDEAEEEHFSVAFNMNYVRPSFFAKEAEPEVREFVSAFDMIVDDPQTDGMGTGEYSSEKFVTGWNHGNEFGYMAGLRQGMEVSTLPSSQLEDMWEWNHGIAKLQDKVRDDIFVPSIMLLSYQNKIVTACVWPDAIPSVIPLVDILIIGRKKLANRKLFKKVEDIAIGTWSQIQPLLDIYKAKMEGNSYILDYDVVPSKIKKGIQKLESINLKTLERLPFDKVLNQELVEKNSIEKGD